MKILIVSSFSPPQNSIASHRPYSWAKYWTLAGHDVTVLTTEKEQDKNVDLELPNTGFKIVEVPLPSFAQSIRSRYRNESASLPFYKKIFQKLREKMGIFNACRMPDLTDLWIRPALQTIKQHGPWDVVISSAGPYSTHIIGHQLKNKGLAKKWIADYRDPWSGNHIYPGLFPFTLIERWIEKHILKKAHLATTASEPFADNLRKKFHLKNVAVVENGFDPEDLRQIPNESIFGEGDTFRLVYTGSLYYGKQNFTPLFKAIQTISNDQSTRHLLEKLEVIFAGPNLDLLNEQIHKMKIDQWVKTIGFVSREDTLRMQRDAHALLLFLWNDPNKDGVLGKIYEYLFSKTPILCIGGGANQASHKLVSEAKAGVVLFKEKEIVQYLLDHLKHIQKESLPSSQHFISQFTRQALAEKLLALISSSESHHATS